MGGYEAVEVMDFGYAFNQKKKHSNNNIDSRKKRLN